MMKPDEIVNKWKEFSNQEGYLQRVDPQHPMDFFIGISINGKDQLVLITAEEPAQLTSSKTLDIEKKKRQDGKWATQISSIEIENREIFAKLCVDLIESSRNVNNENEGISCVAKRFLAWQRLLSSRHTILPVSVLKGAIGELAYARDILSRHYSWDTIIDAWQGPLGGDRDYVFEDCWYEIKAISTGKTVVEISSLDQLEVDYKGYLVQYFVDETSVTDSEAFSFSSFIESLRIVLESYPAASFAFEQKLINLGYEQKKAYDDIYFKKQGPSYYYVDKSFPKLTTHDVPAGIVKAKYELSIPTLEKYKKTESEVWS